MTDPGWSSLLPGHRTDGGDQPEGPPRRVAAIDLAPSLQLAVYQDDRGRSYPVPLLTSPTALPRRARPGDGASEALLALLAPGSRRTGGLEVTTWHHSDATGERAITVDQTNESVIVGERAVVKWAFQADEGPHPGPSLLAALTSSGFAGMPRPWGAVQWRPPDGSPARLLALVVDLLPDAVDGWTWVVDAVRATAQDDDQTPARGAGAAVGALVADFHRALAGSRRPATSEEAATLEASAVADLARATSVSSGPALDLLTTHAEEARRVLAALRAEGTPVMRVHGDLHIGQVLRTGSSYVLTDFDGNPVVPAAERSREQPAASDVAGMAQSFTHAGVVVLKHHPGLDPAQVVRAAQVARASFLDTYRESLGGHRNLLEDRLLRGFALRQVCREFTYAATHLPRWSYVPQTALPMLLAKEA